jgi:hypothetical protein
MLNYVFFHRFIYLYFNLTINTVVYNALVLISMHAARVNEGDWGSNIS